MYAMRKEVGFPTERNRRVREWHFGPCNRPGPVDNRRALFDFVYWQSESKRKPRLDLPLLSGRNDCYEGRFLHCCTKWDLDHHDDD